MKVHSPKFTAAQLRCLGVLTRVAVGNLIHAQVKRLFEAGTANAESVTATSMINFISIEKMVAAVQVWSSQLAVSGLEDIQVVMNDTMYEAFGAIANNDFSDIMSQNTEDPDYQMVQKELAAQPGLIVAMRDAETINFNAPDAKFPRLGNAPTTTKNFLN